MLVCKDVFRWVAQLVQVWQAGVLDHWRWAAQDNEDISGRSWEVVLDHVLGHETGTVAPF